MQLGFLARRSIAVLLLAMAVGSCGDESRGSIEFIRYSTGRNVAAEAGGPITDLEPVGILVKSPTGQPQGNAKVKVLALGGAIYSGLLADITGATPLGDNVELTTNGYGVVEVTVLFTYSAPIDGEFVIMSAFSGSVGNQFTMQFTCFEATAAAPDCP